MLLDYSDELSRTAGPPATSKQSIVGNAAAAIVGGRVKNAGAARDWATGEAKFPYVRTVDALTGATGGVQVDIVVADDATLATNAVVLSTITIAQADFLANKLFAMPALKPGYKRQYCGAKFTPITTNSTAGSLICGFRSKDGSPQNAAHSI
jgi:hypothetical protein